MRNCEVRMAANWTEVQSALALRRQVFVEEQGIFEDSDADENETESITLNAWRNGSILMGTVRCYPDQGESGVWWGGRLAVQETYRLRGIGVYLIEAAVEEMKRRNVKRFLAQVQEQNVKLFEKLGWCKTGAPYFVRGHSHQLMEANLHVHDASSKQRRQSNRM